MTETKKVDTRLFESGAEIGEVESPAGDAPLVPQRPVGQSFIEKWLETNPETAIKRLETVVELLEKLRKLSIKATYPSDWIIHTSKDAEGVIIRQVGYLQDVGAERAGKPWGISISSPAIEREDFPDGTYSYVMISDAWSKVTGERLEYVEGSRWSGGGFFQRRTDGPDDKLDPTVVRKAAFANLHGRAVRALGGLNAVPLDMLTAAGLDVSKVVMIAYDKGAKGGDATGAAVGTSEITMAWGNAKGQKIAELSDKDLDYYLVRYEEDVKNPEKKKWLKNNERTRDALKQEKERRTQPGVVQPPAGQDPKPSKVNGEQGPAAEPGRGKLVSDLYEFLTKHTGGTGQGAFLKKLTKKAGVKETASIMDLSADEIGKILNTPEEIIKEVKS